ncbi:MAG: tetratricopeptide repeat protein, partial [Desulfofustis sp.]|nr:tetratricopeptide repeat protein [Desulfofustis sp.]
DIYCSSLGSDHPAVADARNSLAEICINSGRFEDALPLIESSLAIRRNFFGEHHAAVAQSLNNMAIIYDRRGDQALALRQHEKALEIRETVFGANHPAITQSLDNMAAIYRSQGKTGKATELLEKSLAIWQEAHGELHPAAAQGFHNLATLHIDAQNHEAAEVALLNSRRILEADPEANQMHLATVFETLAGLYSRMGREAESREFAARALKIRKPEQMGKPPVR